MPKNYIIEKIVTKDNYKYVIIFNHMGYRCGYVALKPSHPLFGIEYHQDIKSPELLQEIKSSPIGKKGIIDIFCWNGKSTSLNLLIDVHGGLTYSSLGYNTSYPIDQVDKVWWLGFDCGHCNDARDIKMMQKVFPKRYGFWLNSGIVRTLKYTEDECLRMIQQLDCIKDTLIEIKTPLI